MDVLVLLVGTNPLPAWVTFQALHDHAPDDLKPLRVLLVHSNGTGGQAMRLSEAISTRKVPAELLNVGDDAADPHEIRRLVESKAVQAGRLSGVHLDYTGGTKQMAVQAHAAVQQLARDRAIAQLTCSYLDAKLHLLRFDDGRIFPSERHKDLRSLVRVPLSDLAKLHGCELANSTAPDSASHAWVEIADSYFAAVANDPTAQDAAAWWLWEQFIAEEQPQGDPPARRTMQPREGRRLGGKILVDRGSWMLPSLPSLAPLREGLVRALGLSDETYVVRWTDLPGFEGSLKQQRGYAEKMAEHLHGKWLETWFARQLWGLLPADRRSSVSTNAEIRRRNSSVPAELDVVLIEGYQLFVFSCTTARNRGHVKQKVIEAVHRARQFGGDEARPVLISLLPPTAGRDEASVVGIAADVETDMGDRQGIRIWGIEELRNIANAWRQLLREEQLS